ncbi:hypothetical protein [Zavarzinella formosa]|uniref:hypothetical protein n=1 Tax=Zavarzinella formosa TaxID=360055 RepID=UPI0002F9C64F|nr:hypothetical protein [Zavarzinella formosa]
MSDEMTGRDEKPSLLSRWLAMQKENMAKDTSVSAFLANGLDEIRQAVQPGFSTQVGAGNNPGVWGSITTGEATTERLEGAAQAPTIQAPEVTAMEAPEVQKSILGYELPNVPMQQQENDRSRGR